jgi:hypothetical protein
MMRREKKRAEGEERYLAQRDRLREKRNRNSNSSSGANEPSASRATDSGGARAATAPAGSFERRN